MPNKGYWKTHLEGFKRLEASDRIEATVGGIYYVRYFDDFPVFPISNSWTDTGVAGFASDKRYVVETSEKVIERCLLMTTDPGDLVLDPTCGSGTTAFVAEKWGRRWITCDTSRVAVTLAKQRLMTASYDYYELKYPHEGLKGGFIYKTVPHVTLKSIANNPDIDTIYERMHPAITAALAKLNEFLVGRFAFLVDDDETDFTGYPLKEWEAPFELIELESFLTRHGADPVQLKTQNTQLATLLQHFHEARLAMQREMDRSIAAHADQETLYDQPAISKSKLRVSGPFTVEAVPFPTVKSLDEAGGPVEADASIARTGESGRQHQWRDELLKTGIRGKGGQILRFADLEALPTDADIRNLNATGHLETGERVVVSFGPEHAALEQRQVSNALNEAGHLFPLPKMIVFCAFMFDPEAAKDIDAIKGITALKAQMNTDLLTEDLKKNRASNQSYWLMGQPEVEVLSLAFLVFGERRLCDYDGFAKLSGLDCLAKIHGLGREDLFLYALLAQGRAVWDYLANAQGWDLHTGEYRRGTSKKRPGSESSGIPAVSWHGERLVGGVGDLDFALRQAGLPGLGEFRDVIAGLRRHSETPRRLAQVAHALDFPLSQLVTENTQLTTFHQVEVHGFDYFDTVKGELVSGGKSRIAMWALDPDYDDRSLFPRQVFFPMAGKGEGWEKLKKNLRAELDESRLQQFQGTVSLPFAAGEHRKIAVKIIDDRGIESLKVMSLENL